MPPKGPRLWPRKERRDAAGRVTHAGTWIIRDDGGYSEGTGCSLGDRRGAERALERYLAAKHVTAAATGRRDPAQIPVADVLALYLRDVAPRHARPKETAGRVKRLLSFFGEKTLLQINGKLCRSYAEARASSSARRELEELRAAINHHRREGLCSEIVGVALPAAPMARERWLTRSEIARLLWSAWRYREIQKGAATERRPRRHVARFILVALYTGTRSGAVCGAAFEPTEGRGWIDLEHGMFYRRAAGELETKKRKPPVPIPDKLLGHLKRWRRNGARFAVEFDRQAVKRVAKAFRATARDAGLPGVTPHTLRHTSATWLMQEGVDLWEASGFVGMTVEMLSARYGHHHPKHLENARRALGRSPQARHKQSGEERERTAANVMKIADYSTVGS